MPQTNLVQVGFELFITRVSRKRMDLQPTLSADVSCESKDILTKVNLPQRNAHLTELAFLGFFWLTVRWQSHSTVTSLVRIFVPEGTSQFSCAGMVSLHHTN